MIYKIDETYALIQDDPARLQRMFDFLKVERDGAYFETLVQRGIKSPFNYFSKITDKGLVVYLGHLDMLSRAFGLTIPEDIFDDHSVGFSEEDIDTYYKELSDKKILPFEPYDYQLKAFKGAILGKRQICRMCTSAGKSLTISLIADFYRTRGLKGLLVVPNINLLTQFKSDIESYNLLDLYKGVRCLGGGIEIAEDTFNCDLLITTWQSMMNHKDKLSNFDYLIEDEVHKESAEVAGDICRSCNHISRKLGFTGTLPEDKVHVMELLGLFGKVKTYITARELIDRGLGTPIKINTIFFEYDRDTKNLIRNEKAYPKILQHIKEYEPRNDFIVKLLLKLRMKNENSLCLYQHTEHGKELFRKVMKALYPDVEVENKDITGKKSFEFQQKYHVYFMNGEDDAKTREHTRKALENDFDAILIANFALMSTGVSIKRLHNLVLGSPLKAYTTVTQSLGRGMRLHKDKKEFNVYDLVDDIGYRYHTGVFCKSYNHRMSTSYVREEYPVKEFDVKI
jgi:superfamily II DNA or RNA helicase